MKKNLLATLATLFATAALWVSCASVNESGLSQGSASDTDLAADVQDRLLADGVTRRTPIGISVQDGIVTLTGVMPNPGERARTISVVEGTPGVKSVVDQLRRF